MRTVAWYQVDEGWDGDKVGDIVDAIWPHPASDGKLHYFPCTICDLRGKNRALEVCVRWVDPGEFQATTWLPLDQVHDSLAYAKGNTRSTHRL